MRISLPLISITILLFFFSTSCKNRNIKNVGEGEIHYSITYGGPSGSIPVEMMPKNLIVSFKKDKILFDIQAPFGNTGIANLANHKDGLFDTYVNIIGGRYSYQGIAYETPPGLTSMEGITITPTGKKSEIIGFRCEQAMVKVPSFPDSVFEIWYTRDIDIEKPNAANPFREIDGVLLRFFFIMGEREFLFEADGIYMKPIPDKIFQRREKYKQVSKEAMDQFIIRLVSL